jgi:hypothetical protein
MVFKRRSIRCQGEERPLSSAQREHDVPAGLVDELATLDYAFSDPGDPFGKRGDRTFQVLLCFDGQLGRL